MLRRSALIAILILSSHDLTADPPATFKPLCLGLGGFAYWSSGPFANTMLSGGDWIEFAPNQWGNNVISWNNPQFDTNGYPKYLNGANKLRMLMWVYGGNYSNRPSTWPVRNRQGYGKVTLTWQGDADVRINGSTEYLAGESSGVATGRLVNGRRTYLFTTSIMSHLTVEEINPSNPITDIKVWLPDPADPNNRTLEGQFWHPTFLSNVRDLDFSSLRMMDWGATNQSPQQDWSDRRPPTHRCMQGILNTRAPANGFAGNRPTGVAWEYMIKLANDLDRDLWINVPHQATDDYVTKLAQLMRYGSDGLNPYTAPQADPVHPPLQDTLRLYVEYSNEIWSNGNSFPQGNWAQERATALGITKPQFNARRFCQIWQIFQTVFGDSTRLVRVAAVWTGSSSYTDPFFLELKNYGPTLTPAVQPDIVAPTTYFGNGIQDWAYSTAQLKRTATDRWFLTDQDFVSGSTTRPVSVLPTDAYWTSAKLDADMQATFREWKRRIFSGSTAQGGGPDSTGTGGGFSESLRTSIYNTFGRNIPLVAYEGGPSLYSDYLDGGDSRDDGLTTFLEALNRHPSFAEIYLTQLNMASSKGLRTHSLFVDVSQWGKYGQWGHLEYPDQNPADSVKWQAVAAYENERLSLRHIDDIVGSRPRFATPANLPAGIFGQPYQTEIVVQEGDYPTGSAPRFNLVGSLLVPGLTIAPVPGHSSSVRVQGVPLAGGLNYLYLRVDDADGDSAWQIFNFYVSGGSGMIVESDFTGTNPALHLPWTKVFTQQSGVLFSGWQIGAPYAGSGGTVGGRGVNLVNANDVIKFSVSQGSATMETSTLASALADDEYFKLSITPSADQPLDLRNAILSFSFLRDDYHAPRYWAVFTSLGGYTEGQQIFTSPFSTAQGQTTEYQFLLPNDSTYAAVSTALELRFYPYFSQYGHKASLTGFKLTAVPATPPPTGFALWRQIVEWNGADGDALADPDGDGLANLIEYALGTNPLSFSSSQVIQPTTAGDWLRLSFSRLEDPALEYVIESCPDLNAGLWSEVVWSSTGRANLPGTVTVEDSQPITGSARFLRLRIRQL